MVEKKIGNVKIVGDNETIAVGITPSFFNEELEYIINNNVKRLFFDTEGFKDYSFLEELPMVDSISIIGSVASTVDFPILESVKKLFINECKRTIDLSKFPNLEFCTLDWTNNIQFLTCRSQLKQLVIWKYNPISHSLRELSVLKGLEILEINGANITSLNGIEECKELKQLKLYYPTKLKSISGLDSLRNLEILKIEGAKKISDYCEVRHLHKVHTLSLNNCGEIPTLSFIKEMQSLKDIRFVNTNIMDGNLAYCVGLRNVGFLSKRHYSHKPIDFTA